MFMLLNNYVKSLATLLFCTKYWDCYGFDSFTRGENWTSSNSLVREIKNKIKSILKGSLTQRFQKASLNLALFQSYQEPCLGLDLI